MIIVLEGADMTGKTTLAKVLMKKYDAEYLHMSYKFAGNEFLYHVAMAKKALNLSRQGKIVIIDRCWISELIYSKQYRGGSKVPVMGRYIDRILSKVGVMYIICLHDNMEKYEERYLSQMSRGEMYDKPTLGVAKLYQEAWDGTYDGNDYISSIMPLRSIDNYFSYNIENDPSHIKILLEVDKCLFFMGRMCERFVDVDAVIGDYDNSRILLIMSDDYVVDRPSKHRFPGCKYSGEPLKLTEWLNKHKVNEHQLLFIDINYPFYYDIIHAWKRSDPYRKIIALGEEANKQMSKSTTKYYSQFCLRGILL